MPQNPPEQMYYDQQYLNPGFAGQANPPVFNSFGNPVPPYYVGGYQWYGGPMGPPPMDQTRLMGWGNIAPPMCLSYSKPIRHGDDTMEINETYQPT
jgi:hypothetical protein